MISRQDTQYTMNNALVISRQDTQYTLNNALVISRQDTQLTLYNDAVTFHAVHLSIETMQQTRHTTIGDRAHFHSSPHTRNSLPVYTKVIQSLPGFF